jgi:hypothetical protein
VVNGPGVNNQGSWDCAAIKISFRDGLISYDTILSVIISHKST